MISESDRCDLYTGLTCGEACRRGAIRLKLGDTIDLLGKICGGESAYVKPTVQYSIMCDFNMRPSVTYVGPL
jgi:hypothetical protein